MSIVWVTLVTYHWPVEPLVHPGDQDDELARSRWSRRCFRWRTSRAAGTPARRWWRPGPPACGPPSPGWDAGRPAWPAAPYGARHRPRTARQPGKSPRGHAPRGPRAATRRPRRAAQAVISAGRPCRRHPSRPASDPGSWRRRTARTTAGCCLAPAGSAAPGFRTPQGDHPALRNEVEDFLIVLVEFHEALGVAGLRQVLQECQVSLAVLVLRHDLGIGLSRTDTELNP